MKNLILILTIVIFAEAAYADSINPAVYKTMSRTSYRQNYGLNTQTTPTPYWRTQANPATRNNYRFMDNPTQNFNQDMGQYKYNMKLMRGY